MTHHKKSPPKNTRLKKAMKDNTINELLMLKPPSIFMNAFLQNCF